MKKADRKVVNDGNHAHSFSSRGTGHARIVRAPSRPSWRNFTGKAVAFAVGAVAVLITASFVYVPPAAAQSGNPAFANPKEIHRRAAEKRLRGVIELINGKFLVPGGRGSSFGSIAAGTRAGRRPLRPLPSSLSAPAPPCGRASETRCRSRS